jgi:hypothetical protein
MRARLSLPLARHGSRSRRRSARWLARRRLRSSRLDGLFQKKTKKNSDPTKRRMKSHDSSSRERELVAARGAVADAARAEEDERRPARVMGGRKRCSHGKLKYHCATCSGCPHGKLKGDCVDCNPCPHGKLKRNCADCNPCPHGKVKGTLRGLQPLPARQA